MFMLAAQVVLDQRLPRPTVATFCCCACLGCVLVCEQRQRNHGSNKNRAKTEYQC